MSLLSFAELIDPSGGDGANWTISFSPQTTFRFVGGSINYAIRRHGVSRLTKPRWPQWKNWDRGQGGVMEPLPEVMPSEIQTENDPWGRKTLQRKEWLTTKKNYDNELAAFIKQEMRIHLSISQKYNSLRSIAHSGMKTIVMTPLEYAILYFHANLIGRIFIEHHSRRWFIDDDGREVVMARGPWNKPVSLHKLLSVARPGRNDKIVKDTNDLLSEMLKDEKTAWKRQEEDRIKGTMSASRRRRLGPDDAAIVFLHYHAPGVELASMLNKQVTCLICGVKRFQYNIIGSEERAKDWNMCHIVSHSEDGSDELINLIPGCIDCNQRDTKKPQLEFMSLPAHGLSHRIVPLLHTLQHFHPRLKSMASLEELVREWYVADGTEMSAKLNNWLRKHDQAALKEWISRGHSADEFTSWRSSSHTQALASWPAAVAKSSSSSSAAAAAAAASSAAAAAAAAASSRPAAASSSSSSSAAAPSSSMSARPAAPPSLVTHTAAASPVVAAQTSRKHGRDDDAAQAQSEPKRHDTEDRATPAAAAASTAASVVSTGAVSPFCAQCGFKADLHLACRCVKFCKHCGSERLDFRGQKCVCGRVFER